MKRIVSYIGILTGALMLTGCGSPQPSVPSQDGSRTDFALTFFRNAVSAEDADANVLVSPFSAGTALSMLAEGADGSTRDELMTALGGKTFSGDILLPDSLADVRAANSAWLCSGFEVKDAYRNMLETSYSAWIQTKDFSDPFTKDAINAWCSDNTEGRIPEIVDEISPDMVMFLINALYFKASWLHEFDGADTVDEVFHGSAGDNEVPMMNTSGRFRYAEYDGAQLIELPYKGRKYSMLVALPAEGVAMDKAVSCLSASAYETALDALEYRKVVLSLPKFKFDTDMLLNSVLMRMGVRKAFDTDAEFSGITDTPVAVNQVRQKCFVEVNESGTEAAAVTSIGLRVTSASPVDIPVVMTVDRPFLFAIVDTAGDNILFAGRVMNL